jgi:hypothetical protein
MLSDFPRRRRVRPLRREVGGFSKPMLKLCRSFFGMFDLEAIPVQLSEDRYVLSLLDTSHLVRK